jgi:dienelactone hydrolase
MAQVDLPGYARYRFESDGIVHDVYWAGDAAQPAVLLMPELPGIAPGLLLFAARLREAGYAVHLPRLFGTPGRRTPLRNVLRLCISREFARLRAGESAPVTRWLRALVTRISESHGGGNVGAIGMCLTGAFAIPLVLHPRVSAAVAAQPSVPLSPLYAAFGIDVARGALRAALNVAEEDIVAARLRLAAGDAQLLAVRCRDDRICPPEKLARLRADFPRGLESREYGAPGWRNALGRRPHAIYTKEYRLAPDAPADHPTREAFRDLLSFLDRHLRAAPREQQHQETAEQGPGPRR